MAATFKFRVHVLVIFVFLIVFQFGYTINLDARFSNIKKGVDNSYFGFSVAQHQVVANNDGDESIISPEEAAQPPIENL